MVRFSHTLPLDEALDDDGEAERLDRKRQQQELMARLGYLVPRRAAAGLEPRL